MTSDPEPHRAILRRTLSAISWLYALWSVLLFILVSHTPGRVRFDPRFLLLHAALLALAAFQLWKPRRGALLSTVAAAAGSLGFVGFDLGSHNLEAALVDGAYIGAAAILFYISRTHP